MIKGNKIAWAITFLAVGGIILLNRRKGSPQVTLMDKKNYYPEYDYLGNEHLSRGYRNNNPVNIRKSTNAWNGKLYENTDGEFEQFIDLVHGYRAAIVLLRGRGYINGGLNTIEKIISKFAPANENNTAGYISRVSQMSGIDKDAVIARNDKEAISKIIYAMSVVENDSNKYKEANHAAGLPSMEIINEAWKLV